MAGREKRTPPITPPELREGHLLPYEANPNGTEGVEPGWPGVRLRQVGRRVSN